jgi:hypothetical protein
LSFQLPFSALQADYTYNDHETPITNRYKLHILAIISDCSVYINAHSAEGKYVDRKTLLVLNQENLRRQKP